MIEPETVVIDNLEVPLTPLGVSQYLALVVANACNALKDQGVDLIYLLSCTPVGYPDAVTVAGNYSNLVDVIATARATVTHLEGLKNGLTTPPN